MESLFISALVVALAEIGDKTQLLAIVLATRFKRPVPIILGILVATLANHALAASLGHVAADFLAGQWFQVALGVSFLVMAAWTLIPDKPEEDLKVRTGMGVFAATAIAFFLVEMGDKTQVATIALGAQFQNIVLVTLGTTLGMMLANVPAVYLGEAATKIAPMRVIRTVAAAAFAAIGLWIVWAAIG